MGKEKRTGGGVLVVLCTGAFVRSLNMAMKEKEWCWRDPVICAFLMIVIMVIIVVVAG